MKRRIKHFALWLAWGLCVFLGAIYVHFPQTGDCGRPTLPCRDVSEGEWALDVGDAGLYWLNGAEIRDATLYSIEKPETKKKRKRKKKSKDSAADGPSRTTPVAVPHNGRSSEGDPLVGGHQPATHHVEAISALDRARASVSP